MEGTTHVLMGYLLQLPIILAGLVGIILAIALWGRNPTASVLVLVGSALVVIMSMASPLIHYWVGRQLARGGLRGSEIGTVFGIVGLVHAIAWAVALGLLIAAAFVGRRRAAPTATVIG